MGKVRIVTDSNAFLPPGMQEQYGIKVVPHRVKVGGTFHDEDSNFSSDELFALYQQSMSVGIERLPEIEPADINTMLDVYQELGKETEQIVSIHMSGELSGMWQQARRAAEMLKGRYSIRVIDSKSTSFGLGLLVRKAVQAAEEGADINDVARMINGVVPHLYFTVFAESLNYLERSAQLGPSQSLLGTMLGIKAMLMMEDGRLVPLEKVQTRDEVVDKLHEFVVEFADVEAVGVLQHHYDKSFSHLVERLTDSLPGVAIEQVNYPPSLAAYLGPNAVGVIVNEGVF